MSRRGRALACLSLWLCCAAAQDGAKHVLPRRAAAGEEITRSYRSRSLRELEQVVVRADGQERELEGMSGQALETFTIVVRDEHAALDDAGRLTALERTFEELASEGRQALSGPDGAERVAEFTRTSPFEGLTVRFERDADGATETTLVGASEAEATALAERLPGLNPQMDLSELLPGGPVELDQRWPVDFARFRWALMRPGGYLGWQREPADPLGEALTEAIWRGLEGEVHARLAAWDEEEGVARIAFVAEVSFRLEPPAADRGNVRLVAVTGELELAGELVWDLELGRARSLELQRSGSSTVIEEIVTEAGGSETRVEREQRFRESGELEVRCE